MNLITLAIPVFFILIGLELLIGYIRKSELYRFNDAVTNISCGITQQTTGILLKTALIVLYIYIYNHARIFDLSDSILNWILLFIGIDFFYYWFHRFSHEVNLFWGAHIVHHQSEDYNFSVALRQSSFQGFVSTFFYLPLALIGFSPAIFITINAIQTLYQFWIHTKMIDKMHPWFEFVFNTPSHHRVHHGRNPEYIDKNHGGTLIIFDRLFGSFQPEQNEVVYGVTKPVSSWNPFWANFDYYKDLFKLWSQMRTWKDRLFLMVAKPGWRPEYLGGMSEVPDVQSRNVQKYNRSSSMTMNYYILTHYLIILVFTSYFMFNLDNFSSTWQIVMVGLIVLSVTNLGVILDNKYWVRWSEIIRLFLLGAAAYLFITNTLLVAGSIILLALSAMVFSKYYSPVYQTSAADVG